MADGFVQAYSMEKQMSKELQGESKTKVQEDNLNPLFYEAIDIKVCYNEKLDQLPPFILDVFDRDKHLIGDSADFLGRAIVNYQDSDIEDCRGGKQLQGIPKPKWHPIRAGNNPNMPTCGYVLASFAIFDLDTRLPLRASIKLENYVPKKEFNIDIHVLGVRDL